MMNEYVVPDHNPDVVELPKAFQAPPASLHGAQIEYEAFGNNSALKNASLALQSDWDDGISVNELRANPDGEDRAATHDRKVRELVEAKRVANGQRHDGAIAGLKRELARVEGGLEEAAGLRSDPNWRNAVVGTFHDMPNDGARASAVGELIERGDNASLAALIEAPLVVTKLPAEVRDSIKARVFGKVDPVALKLRDQLALALGRTQNAAVASTMMWANLEAGTQPGAWKERARKAAVQNIANNMNVGR